MRSLATPFVQTQIVPPDVARPRHANCQRSRGEVLSFDSGRTDRRTQRVSKRPYIHCEPDFAFRQFQFDRIWKSEKRFPDSARSEQPGAEFRSRQIRLSSNRGADTTPLVWAGWRTRRAAGVSRPVVSSVNVRRPVYFFDLMRRTNRGGTNSLRIGARRPAQTSGLTPPRSPEALTAAGDARDGADFRCRVFPQAKTAAKGV